METSVAGTMSLEGQILFMRVELLLTVLILAVTALPILYNYVVVNAPKWYESVCYWYDFKIDPFIKFFICVGVVWAAFVLHNWAMTVTTLVILLIMFSRMFSNIWTGTFGKINVGHIYRETWETTSWTPYTIKAVVPIYKISMYEECVSCDEEFVRERGWAVRVMFRDYKSKTVHVCKKCAPTKEDVEGYFKDEQMMGIIHEQIRFKPVPAPTWQGVKQDTYCSKY